MSKPVEPPHTDRHNAASEVLVIQLAGNEVRVENNKKTVRIEATTTALQAFAHELQRHLEAARNNIANREAHEVQYSTDAAPTLAHARESTAEGQRQHSHHNTAHCWHVARQRSTAPWLEHVAAAAQHSTAQWLEYAVLHESTQFWFSHAYLLRFRSWGSACSPPPSTTSEQVVSPPRLHLHQPATNPGRSVMCVHSADRSAHRLTDGLRHCTRPQLSALALYVCTVLISH